MIKHISFKHGWFYHYRIHENKTQELCQNLISLKDYLYSLFLNCPNNYFNSGPRSSALKFNFDINLAKQENNKISILAKEGLFLGGYKTPHSNVQMFMLNYDKNTIGVEIPIWLMPDEYEIYNQLFNDTTPLTGHIDLLQVIDNKIWIWDYKPNAHLEKYATTQTYFYALMLSKRTNLPLENFMCGYFDDKISFTFEPSKVNLPPFISLSSSY